MIYQPKKILVTGGAGFIGSNYIRHILSIDENIFVVNLDKLTYAGSKNNLKNLPDDKRHKFVEGNIADAECVDNILREFDIDTVVHFAAESHVDRSIINPEEFIETNLLGTFTLLECCRQHWLEKKNLDETQCRFHHISTDEVFGTLKPEDPAFSETTAYAPNSPYSASKAGSDHLARAYLHTYKLPVTMSNCSNNYGPYQHGEKLIPTIIRSCVKQEPIPVYGDGSNIRDWLYVEDHCEAIHQIVCHAQTGESYNVGGNMELANIDLVRKICSIMDNKNPENAPHENLISFVTDRAGHDWRYAINSSKIKQDLNWQAKTNLEGGLLNTVEFELDRL